MRLSGVKWLNVSVNLQRDNLKPTKLAHFVSHSQKVQLWINPLSKNVYAHSTIFLHKYCIPGICEWLMGLV